MSEDSVVKRHRTLLRYFANTTRAGKFCFADKSEIEMPGEILFAFEHGTASGLPSTCLNKCVDDLIVTTTARLQRYVRCIHVLGVLYIAVMRLATILRSA